MPDMPPEKNIGPWRVTGSREIHRTPWLRVREDSIIWPNGHAANWTVVECHPAVGIVALTDDHQVHLVGQHRYAVDRYEWEVPAGGVDAQEDLLAAARRELKEETGLSAERWTSLGGTHGINGSCDSIYHLFLAQGLTAGDASPEETELLAHKLLPLEQVLAMCQSGEMMDALTVVAIFRAWHHLNEKERG